MPAGLVGFEHLLPTTGQAIDVACGAGGGSVWLADRGLAVLGVDASPVAIEHATALAASAGLSAQCRFEVVDLDNGLPDGAPVDLVVCHRFNSPAIDAAMLTRLVPGGVLAVTVLSEVGAEAGRFRVAAGALLDRFAHADVLAHREADGEATVIVRSAGPEPHGRLD